METFENYTIANLKYVFNHIETHPLKYEFEFNETPYPYEIVTLREFINNMNLFNMNDIDHGYLVRAIQYRAKHQEKSVCTTYKDKYTVDLLVRDIRKTIGYINTKKYLKVLHMLYDNVPDKTDKRQKLNETLKSNSLDKVLTNGLNTVRLISTFYYGEEATLDDLEKLIYAVHKYENTGYIGDIDNMYDILDLFVDLEELE
jgi:hypothetical protein